MRKLKNKITTTANSEPVTLHASSTQHLKEQRLMVTSFPSASSKSKPTTWIWIQY